MNEAERILLQACRATKKRRDGGFRIIRHWVMREPQFEPEHSRCMIVDAESAATPALVRGATWEDCLAKLRAAGELPA
jgi:hypothetical protein